MKIAATWKDDQIFQHFGQTEAFMIYDVENGKVTEQKLVHTNGSGHGALAGFLTSNNVDVLICGGIGDGAKASLVQAGIQMYPGVTGSVDRAVEAFLAKALVFDANIKCNHHGHGHDAEHSCGNHTCTHETI